MSGTKAGAAKTTAKNLAADPNYYSKLSAKGVLAYQAQLDAGTAKPRGIAVLSAKQRTAIGKKASSVRWNKAKAKDTPIEQ